VAVVAARGGDEVFAASDSVRLLLGEGWGSQNKRGGQYGMAGLPDLTPPSSVVGPRTGAGRSISSRTRSPTAEGSGFRPWSTRWTLVFGKARLREDGTRHADIAIPVFGYKSHASIDRRHGFIRKWDVTDASRHDGRMLRRGLLDATNTGTTVWADSAYRSMANEAFMERHGFRSQVHHRKPKGRPMPPHIRRGNASRSRVRAAIEHVFAHQKGPMALCIRTIGIARARVKIGLANLTYNIRRLVRHERLAPTA
jgi:transposase, IS5 family